MSKFTQAQHTRFTEKTLSLFVKFIMVCEDNYNRIKEEQKYFCCQMDSEAQERINHYLLLYKDVKEHTGLSSTLLEPKLKELEEK